MISLHGTLYVGISDFMTKKPKPSTFSYKSHRAYVIVPLINGFFITLCRVI